MKPITEQDSGAVIQPIDLEDHGLNLNSTTSDFVVEFAPSPSFDDGVVKLTKEWRDDMGLHLLQRSMLPQRILRCLITLNGVLKLSESYESAMRRSINVSLSDLMIDAAYEVDEDFLLQLSLSDSSQTFVLQEHYEANKFKLGGVAKREIEARGFQIAEVRDNKHAVTNCRCIRITVKRWRNINDSQEFSPEVVQLIRSVGDQKSLPAFQTSDSTTPSRSNREQDLQSDIPSQVTINSQRPCTCWARGTGADGEELEVKHSDVCDSYWAALFQGYADSMRPKKTPAGGLGVSRWAGRG